LASFGENNGVLNLHCALLFRLDLQKPGIAEDTAVDGELGVSEMQVRSFSASLIGKGGSIGALRAGKGEEQVPLSEDQDTLLFFHRLSRDIVEIEIIILLSESLLPKFP
jgi:hypothetical protein